MLSYSGLLSTVTKTASDVMTFTLSAPFSYHPTSLLSCTALNDPYSNCATFLDLPNDVLLDYILPLLPVRDIVRVQRVCKLLYQLTRHSTIWKRLLRMTELPIPPLAPTIRHCLKHLTAFEAEKLMIRTASIDWNWNWINPSVLSQWKFDAFHSIKQMVLLPGSQYMVASVSETSGQYWSIVVFLMDGRYSVVPIAKLPTGTKACHLQARYLTVGGVVGITIAYMRRAWRHRADAQKGIDISDYSGDHEIDPAYPVKYECHAVHVPLAAMEELCDPRLVPGSPEFLAHARSKPPPFRRLCFIRSSRPLGKVTLDEVGGVPTVTVQRYPNSLMIKPLCDGPATILTFRDLPGAHVDGFPVNVKAFRHLPNQNQVLVVREYNVPAGLNPFPITVIEFHNVPKNTKDKTIELDSVASDFMTLYEDKFADVWITEQGYPNWFGNDDEGIVAEKYTEKYAPFKPRCMNMFLRCTDPEDGLVRMTFYPQYIPNWSPPFSDPPNFAGTQLRLAQKPMETVGYFYGIDNTSPSRWVSAPEGMRYHILPGAYRTLAFTVRGDTITEAINPVRFFRYYDEDIMHDAPVDYPPGTRNTPITSLGSDLQLPEKCLAFAWDEMLTRMVFTVEGTSQVHVVDFAMKAREDIFGRRFPLAIEGDHDWMNGS